jgi:hypothetical protein
LSRKALELECTAENGIMQPVSMQRIGKHVPAAMNTHAIIQLLLETVFYIRPVQRGYKKNNWETRNPRLGICGRYPFIEIAAPAKQGSPHHWQFSKAHTGSRIAHGFHHPVHVRFYNKIMQAASRSHTKP